MGKVSQLAPEKVFEQNMITKLWYSCVDFSFFFFFGGGGGTSENFLSSPNSTYSHLRLIIVIRFTYFYVIDIFLYLDLSLSLSRSALSLIITMKCRKNYTSSYLSKVTKLTRILGESNWGLRASFARYYNHTRYQ